MAILHGSARYSGKLVVRTNTCGGNNKAGLSSTIGKVASNHGRLACNGKCPLKLVCESKKFIRIHYRAGRKYLG